MQYIADNLRNSDITIQPTMEVLNIETTQWQKKQHFARLLFSINLLKTTIFRR